MQDFSDLYIEQGEAILTIDGIAWVDLWNEQVNFLEDEFAFPSPAVFLSYLILDTKDMGDKAQDVKWQVDVRLFYETMASTDMEGMNRGSALKFTKLLTDIHKKFHGQGGTNFREMRRIGMSPEATGGSGTMYRLSFTCMSVDTSANKVYNDSTIAELMLINEKGPEPEPENDYKYIVD